MQEPLQDLRRHLSILIDFTGEEVLKKIFGNICVLFCIFMAASVVLTGCGKKSSEGLDTYRDKMTSFYDMLSYLNKSINAIDPDSETAKDELLGYLDEMNNAYSSMAACEVPEEFSGIADIAVEAADYMQKADEYYHMAYDGTFDENSESLASQYYERANSRAMVMLQVLHGEVPTGDGVVVTTQEPGQFSTISDGTDDT